MTEAICCHCYRPPSRPHSVYELVCEQCGKLYTSEKEAGNCPHCGVAFVIVRPE